MGCGLKLNGKKEVKWALASFLCFLTGYKKTRCLGFLPPCPPHHDGLRPHRVSQNEPVLPQAASAGHPVTLMKKWLKQPLWQNQYPTYLVEMWTPASKSCQRNIPY